MMFGTMKMNKTPMMKNLLYGVWQFLSFILVPRWCIKK
ncbi:hypothetical protein M116_0808 [Bacteroides fragilis str. 3719 A10]|nr:hypothetical protein M116_0808 [Bacteroides fragilis str. 3719 A10]EYA81765.1 hypothetical protein M134_0835 [Bacteroides fragilis str. S24L34]OCR37316.1 hypothetical protein AC140_07590 [Bacteroides fragilis]